MPPKGWVFDLVTLRRHAADRARARRAGCRWSTASRCWSNRPPKASPAVRREAAARSGRRAVAKAAAHDHARAHRVDRHGQVDRRRDVRRGAASRCSTPMPSAHVARAGRRAGRRDRGALSRDDARRRGRSRCAGRARCSATRDELAALEAIVHPAVHAARARFLARSRRRAGACCSTFPCCSKPAATRRSTRLSSSPPRPTSSASACSTRPGMTDGQFRIDPRPANARRRKARARRFRHRHAGGPIEARAPGGCDPRLSRDRNRSDKQAMREIIFDTETTGLSPAGGDRLVEIGCIEMINRGETGRHFHAISIPSGRCRARPRRSTGCRRSSCRTSRCSPTGPRNCSNSSAMRRWSRTMPRSISASSITSCRCGRAAVCMSRMVDTLGLARTRHPGAKHSLDALCSRFGVDRSQRVKHGALLDAQLLAQVYVELTGGRQIGLGLVADRARARTAAQHRRSRPGRSRRRAHMRFGRGAGAAPRLYRQADRCLVAPLGDRELTQERSAA